MVRDTVPNQEVEGRHISHRLYTSQRERDIEGDREKDRETDSPTDRQTEKEQGYYNKAMSSQLRTFKLERYFAQYEFTIQHMLSCSDPEPFTQTELLALADEECSTLWHSLSLGYTESAGHPDLLTQIAEMYPGLTTDQVLGVVPQEGIYMAMKVLANLSQRDSSHKPHVIATFPAYQSLYENLRANGCDVTYWRVKADEKEWDFDLNDLQALLREDTKVVVVNFPHNPTGYIPSEQDWRKLINICKERDIFLFSDEMYRLTNNDGTTPYPSACCLYDKAISLFGLSKTFGLPGLRVGWLCTQNQQVMDGLRKIKDYLTICGSAPSEILAIIALRNKEKLLEKIMGVIKENLKILDEFFAEFSHLFCWRRPKASTTGFVELRSWTLQLRGGGAEGFCEALREECGILLLPSSMYEFDEGFVRLGFGRKDLKEIIPIFREFLLKYDQEFNGSLK